MLSIRSLVESGRRTAGCTSETQNLQIDSYRRISHLEFHLFFFEQAIDRLHRLGQYRPIRAVRFVAEGTVEERVLQLQEKKRLVFDGTVGRDAGSLKMLTAEDMKALFA